MINNDKKLSESLIRKRGTNGDKTSIRRINENNGDVFEIKNGVFETKNGVLIKYYGNGGKVIIPDGITSIGNYAFRNRASLTNVIIPDSVIEIGRAAFFDCKRLTRVSIPNSVTEIGEFAFFGCTSLTHVTIPDSVTEIGIGTFQNCSSLTNITIPDSVTLIRWDAFRGCTSLASVTIPDSVASIEMRAFEGCKSLRGVTIPDGVTSIEEGTFSGCTSLTHVTIPDSVTEIERDAFSRCTSLMRINIPDSVTEIGMNAFPKSCKIIRYNVHENKKFNSGDKKLLEALITKYGKSGVNLAINRLNEASSKINFSLERIGYDIGMYWIKNNNRKVGLFVFAENSDNIFYIKNGSEELLQQFENFFYNDAEFIDYGLSELYQRKKYYSEAFNDIESFVKYMYGAFNRTEARNFAKAIRTLLKNDPQFEEYYDYKLYDYHQYE